MVDRLKTIRVLTVIASIVAVTAGLSSPAQAAPNESADKASVQRALQRDLGLSTAQVAKLEAAQAAAPQIETTFRTALDERFGGTWIDDAGVLRVGVTKSGDDAAIRALGAVPTRVKTNEKGLNARKGKLDAALKRAPKEVTQWFVDVPGNRLVVRTLPGQEQAARTFAARAGLAADAFAVEVDAQGAVPVADLRGGDPYYIGGSRCSVGLAVQGGFVTAGHCGQMFPGQPLTGPNRAALGTWGGYAFPGRDMGWVRTNSSWNALPEVTGIGPVMGSAEAVVGSSVCRSGSTTGVRCGVIRQKNVTVNYPQGAVNGLTWTTACADGGDSGGAFMAGSQAQGVTSGKNGECGAGGTSYYQPLNPILSTYGLTLKTAGVPGATAFQANTTSLWSIDQFSRGDWKLGMMPGTSPSIAKLANGGYQIAFQANTGNLWTVGSAGNRDWQLGMMAGTSPAITGLTGGGFEVAFQANTGNLWYVGSGGGSITRGDRGLGMMRGTSPAIAALKSGGFQVAFQANTGNLWTIGEGPGSANPGDWGLGMMHGTSPAITGLSGGGYQVAFQANTTSLWTVGSAGNRDWQLGMMTGTSPAIAGLAGGGFQVAFQANTTSLWTVGSAGNRDWQLGMMTGTSPAIAALPAGGFQVDFQANTGNLWSVGAGAGSNTVGDRGLGMMRGTSPAIA